MGKPRWLLALPPALALAATAIATPGTARAASVRDEAKMFSAEAVQKAQASLTRIERENQIPITIETIPSLNGEEIADLSLERARGEAKPGMYILIAKQEHKIYDRVAKAYSQAMTGARQRSIRQAFETEFKKGDFDAGLLQGVQAIGTEVSAAHAEAGGFRKAAPGPIQGRPGLPARRGNQGGFGLGSLLGIGLVIIGVLFVFRLLGSLMRGGGGYAPGGRMGGPGYGPGYGGGGGGGFMSSLFGGIGGAMAGNWLYDQFSGRHGGTTDSSTYGGDAGAAPQGDEWGGGTGGGGDWGGGGGDAGGGGGDWGGGGGGGDWGGGGGDTGGGGGDW